MGHIGNGHGPQAQQAYQTTAVSQELTLGLALFRTWKGVLLPPFDPTLVSLEHVHGTNVTGAIVFTGIGRSGLHPLGA